MVTITGLIILGIVLDLGGGPSHDRIGFRYWKRPGPFNQYEGIAGAEGRFLGWWAVMTQAAFSFIGTEVIAIAGAEAKNPRRNIPRAIRNVYIRLLLFYIGGVTIIGFWFRIRTIGSTWRRAPPLRLRSSLPSKPLASRGYLQFVVCSCGCPL